MNGVSLNHPTSLAQLEEAATERWGEDWSLKLTKYADETAEARVIHMNGVVGEADGESVVEQEQLLPGEDGDIHFERVRFKRKEYVDESEIEPLASA